MQAVFCANAHHCFSLAHHCFSVGQAGNKVIYSKYAGTEVEFQGEEHLILKEEDVIGLLSTDDVKDMKPLGDRVLIKVSWHCAAGSALWQREVLRAGKFCGKQVSIRGFV
jgi:co-chaperonin GroES (HSP10)